MQGIARNFSGGSLGAGEGGDPSRDGLTSSKPKRLSRAAVTDDNDGKDLFFSSSSERILQYSQAGIATAVQELGEEDRVCYAIVSHSQETSTMGEGDVESEEEVDSRDAAPVREPIHRSLESTETNTSVVIKPRLTLSAFRRPEHTIRLTRSDPNRRIESEYDLHAPACGVLGHGAFSTVRLAVRISDGVKVAVKSIEKHQALRSHRLRFDGEGRRGHMEEWDILRRFHDHPYVITLLDVFETDEEIQLVTEYCSGGELFDAIQKKRNRAHAMRRGQYSETQAARITSQVLRALVDLHALNIIHRDLKAENILLASDDDSGNIHIKLCDFGVARQISPDDHNAAYNSANASDGEASPLTPGHSRSFSTIGSDYYAAPELIYGSYDTAVDIYSLGVTLYILLCGFPPVFSGHNAEDVVFPMTYWKDISEDAKEFVRSMLKPDPADRVSAEQALQDKWIRSNVDVQAPELSQRVPSDPQLVAEDEQQGALDAVRNQLYKTLGRPLEESSSQASSILSPLRKRVRDYSTAPDSTPATSPRKQARRFDRRASSAFMALADLYQSVASSPSVSAIAAAAASTNNVTARGEPAADEEESEKPFAGTAVATLSF
jgi:calcium-dependent protein kinase